MTNYAVASLRIENRCPMPSLTRPIKWFNINRTSVSNENVNDFSVTCNSQCRRKFLINDSSEPLFTHQTNPMRNVSNNLQYSVTPKLPNCGQITRSPLAIEIQPLVVRVVRAIILPFFNIRFTNTKFYLPSHHSTPLYTCEFILPTNES